MQPYHLIAISVSSLLAGGLLGAGAGWLFTARKKSRAARPTPDQAFVRGISHIIKDEPEEASQEMTRHLRLDSHNAEAFMALANLFRRRGDLERAVGIRQKILDSRKTSKAQKMQALYALGRDFRQAGMIDRALAAFEELALLNPRFAACLAQLTGIFEETRDWDQAYAWREKLAALEGGDHSLVLAHYLTEMGKEKMNAGATREARELFLKAMELNHACADAYLHLGDLYLKEKKTLKAAEIWRQIATRAPFMSFLAYGRLARVLGRLDDLKPVEDFLKDSALKASDPLPRLALAHLYTQRQDYGQALVELNRVLEVEPGLLEVHKEIGRLLLEQERHAEALAAYARLLDHLKLPAADFQCQACGFSSPNLMWRCPECHAWDTMQLIRKAPALKALGQSLFTRAVAIGRDEG